MKYEGSFIFKGLGERAGGKFTNNQGREITYHSANTIKVDELLNGKPVERFFKFSKDDTSLKEKFEKIDLYADVTIVFDVKIYNNSVSLVPVDVIWETEE